MVSIILAKKPKYIATQKRIQIERIKIRTMSMGYLGFSGMDRDGEVRNFVSDAQITLQTAFSNIKSLITEYRLIG